jgi:microcin C transport system substrate-binding protein
VGTLGSFDSLNPYTSKGDPISAGVNETLMTRSLDEPSAEYGLIAEGVWYPDDFSMAVFKLRPEAKFHDGEPIKPEDVIFSFEELKKNNNNYAAYYKDVSKAEKTGDHEVTFTFSTKGNRELPNILGQFDVLPKHWWTAKDAAGKQRDLAASTLEAPLGSGPYKVAKVNPGLSILTTRVADYWGKDLAVNQGKNNFDEVEVQLYQDRAVILEAFKGGQFDIQLETSSKQWATGYDVPAVKDGRIIKEQIPRLGVSGMQCWVVNLRRPLFQGRKVRMALDLAFDFEWSNTNLFYGLYTRCRSYFGNSELEAKGLPSPEELKLLEPLRGKIPEEVFTTEYVSFSNSTPQDRRKNLRQAQGLLKEAGWEPQEVGGKQILKNAKGESFKLEITLDGPAFERIALPYKEQMQLLGIEVTVRTVDAAQYERIKEQFDYDMISSIFPQSLSPGNEQRDFFGTEFVSKPKTRNEAGIADPAVDALIDQLIAAPNREALIVACRALDRVLIWNRYVIPCWYKPEDWIAYWKRVKHPQKMPGYALGYPTIWWFDTEADAAIKKI